MSEWTQLLAACRDCHRCPLGSTRTNLVFGVGNPEAEILFVGEGPGEQEDLKGEPFVGKAGVLLDKMLACIGMSRRNNVYIANIVKCRPPHNRDPLPEERQACLPYLRAQTKLIRPKIIVCLGKVAATTLIDPNFSIMRSHGVWYERKGFWMIATFHPAALLRKESLKRDAYSDLLRIRAKYEELSVLSPEKKEPPAEADGKQKEETEK